MAVVPRGVLGGTAKGVVGAAGLGTGGPLGRCPEALGGIVFGIAVAGAPACPAGNAGAPDTMVVLVSLGPGPVLESATEPGREPCATLPRRDLLRAGTSCAVVAACAARAGAGGGNPAVFAGVGVGAATVWSIVVPCTGVGGGGPAGGPVHGGASSLDSSQNLRVDELVSELSALPLALALAFVLAAVPRLRGAMGLI